MEADLEEEAQVALEAFIQEVEALADHLGEDQALAEALAEDFPEEEDHLAAVELAGVFKENK